MSVYEQRRSPFDDDLLRRAAHEPHALEQPVPDAPSTPPGCAASTSGRRSRPGLTGARPRSSRRVPGVLVLVAAGAVLSIGASGALDRSEPIEPVLGFSATSSLVKADPPPKRPATSASRERSTRRASRPAATRRAV
ncbi:MAG: hypothetical protein Q8O56_00485, partial [Solirubrobacteraceae bacterium]|nr:hypothetical protein [Solirubrobacteraceae bacterium]